MSKNIKIRWSDIQNLDSHKFTCGHCGNPLVSDKGFIGNFLVSIGRSETRPVHIYICHYCTKPTFIAEGSQVPGVPFGNTVDFIDDKFVNDLFNEARRCCQVNSYTAAVLCCRKLLMNIAVNHEANKDLNSKQYVDYLYDQGIIPKGSKEWVDFIRDKGNEANHEIEIMEEDDAIGILSFSEILLKIIYETKGQFKNITKKKLKKPSDAGVDTGPYILQK